MRAILCLKGVLQIAALASGLLCAVAAAEESAERIPAGDLRSMVDGHALEAIALYREFLAIPNDANHPEQIQRLNAWIRKAFEARGFETRELATAGSPSVYAEKRSPGAGKTVLVYLQADGQPVDPAAWSQPDPYEAVLKEQDEAGDWRIIDWGQVEGSMNPDWRVFARSAADSKGPMTQFLVASELLASVAPDLGYHLKVLVDTEEELGSPHLADAVREHSELLAADMLLIFDGPPHASNRPTVSLGARGIATVTLTAWGPIVAQHSGHYGNFVPNPAMDLAHVLSSLKTRDGVVAIDGFYDGVEIDDRARSVLESVPDDEEAILSQMGLIRADTVAETLQEAIQYPSLNIRGLSAAWTGRQSRTIIPSTAVAEIDIRLVKESNAERLIALLREHIEAQGVRVLDHVPSDEERRVYGRMVTMTHHIAYGAFRTDPDAPPARMARAGMRELYGEEPILIRTMGGSIPIAPIIEALGVPAAIVPTVNMDNNQHSPNENLRLGNFLEGIVILMSVLQQAP